MNVSHVEQLTLHAEQVEQPSELGEKEELDASEELIQPGLDEPGEQGGMEQARLRQGESEEAERLEAQL